MKDDLFSTLLYLVPLAVILFFRVFAAKRKSQTAEARKTRQETARQELARRVQAELDTGTGSARLSRISGREPEAQEWEPHWMTREGNEPAPAAPTRPPQGEGPGPLERLVLMETETRTLAPVLPAEAGELASLARPPALNPRVSEAQAVPGAAAEAARGSGSLPPFLDRLPPLRKAVVMAEILGPPKGA